MLEVDDSMLRGRGRWAACLRSTTACSGSGTKQRHAPRPGTRRRRDPGLGSRMVDGGCVRGDRRVSAWQF
jgi:hypothetical protein